MTNSSPTPSRRARRPLHQVWPLGAAALLAAALFGVRYLHATSQVAPAEPSRADARPGLEASEERPQAKSAGPRPEKHRDLSRSSEPAKMPGPKVVEERVPTEGAQPSQGDQDPGPGPHLMHYDGRSGRLSPNASPHRIDAPPRNVSQGTGPKLIVWAASTRVTLGQPATIRAVVAQGEHLLVPDSISVAVAARGKAAAAPAAPMTKAPAGDESQFVYSYTPSTSSVADNPSSVKAPSPNSALRAAPPQEYEFVVHATGAADGAPFDKVTGGFFLVQDSGARLDASKAALDFVHGNLELALDVHVERPGAYLASAELWAGGEGEQPVAFARQRLEETVPGEDRVTLLFGGRVIRDANIDGPYVVRNVRLQAVDSIPPHESAAIDELPKTRDYRAADFY